MAMTRPISATEVHLPFDDVMRPVVEDQTSIVVDRGGEPRVVVISAAEYERLRRGEPSPAGWRETLARAHDQIRREGAGPLSPPPEEVIRQMREERDARTIDLR
jgi:prevent-host-death family protein